VFSHKKENGVIMGEKISLGSYDSDYSWANVTNENASYPKTNLDLLYHEQYYENGSLCELNGKQRKTILKVSLFNFIVINSKRNKYLPYIR
jgi:hypothetical protein